MVNNRVWTVVDAASAEWFAMWRNLARLRAGRDLTDHEAENWLARDPDYNRTPGEGYGEGWQYMASVQVEAERGRLAWVHQFRHRFRRDIRQRCTVEIRATEGWRPAEARG